MNIKTPLLVDTSTSFEDYIKRLAKTDRKKFRASGLDTIPVREIPYDSDKVWRYCKLWEQQKVGGRSASWVHSREHMDGLPLVVLETGNVGLHFFERYGLYGYAHPPLYDKRKHNIARMMWFATFRWCCENGVKAVNLGGRWGRTWPDLIRDRFKPGTEMMRYKWAYVPHDVKEHPEREVPWVELTCKRCGWKSLVTTPGCPNCKRINNGHT